MPRAIARCCLSSQGVVVFSSPHPPTANQALAACTFRAVRWLHEWIQYTYPHHFLSPTHDSISSLSFSPLVERGLMTVLLLSFSLFISDTYPVDANIARVRRSFDDRSVDRCLGRSGGRVLSYTFAPIVVMPSRYTLRSQDRTSRHVGDVEGQPILQKR